ncbi:MAG TPA: hypothetical protein VE153_31160 [Myxococcus sp.]|nr:hypothetical protein [Myxococcus sp.]
MDDEDDGNDNYRWGWVGATQQNSSGTTFGFCRVDGERFGSLPRASWVDLTAQAYAVLKLGSSCPPGTYIEFTRNFDNEDKNNRNWRQGNIGPNVSNSNTSLRFCMFMPSNSGVMNGFPSLGGEYGVFAAGGFASFYGLSSGHIHTDDEDRRNANSWNYHRVGGINTIIHSIISGVDNTDLRTVRVKHRPAPCTRRVYYHTGASLSAQYDGANCYIKPVPSSGTPFIYANNYYVTAGPNNTCAEGFYDGRNCYIMSAPSGTTAFKWGNAFYYAE